MKPIHVLVLLSGVDLSKNDVDIVGTGFVRAFEDLGYQFGGEILSLTGPKYTAFPQINLYGFYSVPTAWIFGLDPREWPEDRITSLAQQIRHESGVQLLTFGNYGG